MFSQTLAHGNSKNEIDKETDEEGKKRSASMGRSKAGTKEKKISPDGLIHPNQNTIIIKQNLLVFYKRWRKRTMKLN